MKRILIIEDDPIVAHIYRTRLEREGYTIETSSDGQAGFYRIHEFHPDGVLLDLMLPRMNGIDILKKIRAQSQFQRVPIIVFTNAYVPNMIQEAFAAGASHVFNKATLTPRQILDSLHALLNPGNTGSLSEESMQGRSSLRYSPDSSGSLRDFTDAGLHENVPASHHSTGEAGDSKRGSFDRDDSEFVRELRHSFVESSSETLGLLRRFLQDFSKAQSESARVYQLGELYRKVHALTGSAGIAGLAAIAQMAAALEVLLKELQEKPKNINASTLRTIAHSLDFIGELFRATADSRGPLSPANILVVDDEILSRRAVTYALEKADLKSINVEDSAVALKMATDYHYDLIFLDIQMPGMDGFELCSRIRALPKNSATPIIFITSLTDFKSRAKSTLSGGTDLIAKPFMFIELTVKALTHVLRGQLENKKAA